MNRFLLLSISIATLSLSACADINQAYNTLSNSVRSGVDKMSVTNNRAATTENLLSADNVTKNCPQVQVIDELSSLSDFSDISQQKDYNLISRVQLQEGASNCIYSAGNVRVDVKLVLESVLGTQGQAMDSAPSFTYPFFVAVTDAQNNILAKEVFSAAVNYTDNELRHTYFENLRQIIPITNRSDGMRHKILVGFQLTDEQLAYNRRTLSLPTRVQNEVIETQAVMDAQTDNVVSVTTDGIVPSENAQATEAPLSLNDKVIMELHNRAQTQPPVKSAPPL